MKKTLYLECFSGISGDMTVAALLDLGVDPDELQRALGTLPLDGFTTRVSRVTKAGIDACDFDVVLAEDNHDHSHHHHTHRGLAEILDILGRSGLSDRAKELASKIFRIIAEAESKAHRVPVEEVHFHEVGAVDSIVDIAAVSFCIDYLGVEDVIVPVLYEGTGTVRCQHGILPVPVPAVLNIAEAHHLDFHFTPAQGEFVTPTGAAIVAALRTAASLPGEFTVLKTGIGAGKRYYERPSLLRAMLIEDRAAVREDHILEAHGLESPLSFIQRSR